VALGLEPLAAMAVMAAAGTVMYMWYGLTSWRAIQAYEAGRRQQTHEGNPPDDGADDRPSR
jgi:hypothetical protein